MANAFLGAGREQEAEATWLAPCCSDLALPLFTRNLWRTYVVRGVASSEAAPRGPAPSSTAKLQSQREAGALAEISSPGSSQVSSWAAGCGRRWRRSSRSREAEGDGGSALSWWP